MTAGSRPLVLVLDDREDLLRFAERSLADRYEFVRATCARGADAVLRARAVRAVLLDRDFSHADPATLIGPPGTVRDEGLHLLRWLRHEHGAIPVLMVSGFREVAVAVAVTELGADFLAWEEVAAAPDLLRAQLERTLRSTHDAAAEALERFRAHGLVAESPALGGALAALLAALPGDSPILLLGESGTGKDTLAKAAHGLSGDPGRPFELVNLAAPSASMIEDDLFGHVERAITDVPHARPGRIRSADGGTLFLNEIANLSLEHQAKLLTVLDRGEVVPLGSDRPVPVRFRLFTATSEDLQSLVAGGRFRKDLYFRIAGHVIEVPPLRARREDVAALAHAFLREAPAFQDGTVFAFTREALEDLATQSWPGNVRELRHVVLAACARARHHVTIGDVREILRRHPRGLADAAAPATEPAGSPREAVATLFGTATHDALTAAYFRHLVLACGGQMAEVARRAGVSRSTVYEWRRRYLPAGAGEPALDP